MSEAMNDATNICLSCGLCCDGTLIGFVQLDAEELPAVKEFMDIEVVQGNGVFLHPCDKYCDGCTVYAKRPRQCASFQCGLLKSVEQQELDFNAAVETVQEVKQRKQAIESKIAALQLELHSPSFYFRMLELKKLLRKNTAAELLTEKQLDLLSDLKQLDRLLSERFDLSI